VVIQQPLAKEGRGAPASTANASGQRTLAEALEAMADAVANAVRSISASIAASDREILQAILYSPRHSASALQLKTLLNLPSIVQANSAIGRFGKKVFQAHSSHPDGYEEGNFQWWTIAATGHADSTLGFVWTLRDGIVRGLLDSGYSDSGLRLAEEISDAPLSEGSFKRIQVNAYERNPVARARCIAAHGATCSVCGFEFASFYGAEAEGFIHVHHLKPLSEIQENYEVDPIVDLVPVCPNCHAVIHMTHPPKTIAQVRSQLASSTPLTPKPLRGSTS
jgi:predicted HNH restriction endonuclease